MTARQWLRALVSVGLVALTAWFIDLRGLGRQLAGMRFEPAIWAAVLSVPQLGTRIRTVVSEVRTSMLSGGAWAVQLGASLLAVALLGAMFYLCAVAVGAPVDGRQALQIAPLVLAASALPISVGGWGVREATAVGLFGLMGLDATQGAAASAAFGAVSLVTALPGAFILLSKRGEV